MKTIFSTFLIFLSVQVFSQFTVLSGGNTVAPNTVFSYPDTNGTLALQITNNSSTSKRFYVKVEELVNTFGTDFSICIEQCYWGFSVGSIFPPSVDPPYVLAANQTSLAEHFHFQNMDNGFGDFPMDYKFSIYETDNNGVATGTPFYFTFRYNPSMASSDIAFKNLKIYPTVSQDLVTINDTEKTVKYSLYDIFGRQVVQSERLDHEHQVNISDLSAQTYILKVEDATGNFATQKIIKL